MRSQACSYVLHAASSSRPEAQGAREVEQRDVDRLACREPKRGPTHGRLDPVHVWCDWTHALLCMDRVLAAGEASPPWGRSRHAAVARSGQPRARSEPRSARYPHTCASTRCFQLPDFDSPGGTFGRALTAAYSISNRLASRRSSLPAPQHAHSPLRSATFAMVYLIIAKY